MKSPFQLLPFFIASIMLCAGASASIIPATYQDMGGMYQLRDSTDATLLCRLALVVRGQDAYVQFMDRRGAEPVKTVPVTGKKGWTKLVGGKITFQYQPLYSETLREITLSLVPDEKKVEVADPEGVLGGGYVRNGAYFLDEGGYMYTLVDDGSRAELCWGGCYMGHLKLPISITRYNETYEVAGIGQEALYLNYDVDEVSRASWQYVKPGAYMFSGVKEKEDDLQAPVFIYPDNDFSSFAMPLYYNEGKATTTGFLPWEQYHWIAFKHNLSRASYIRENTTRDGKCGRADFDFESTTGPYWRLNNSVDVIPKMFRGYTSIEVEALAMGSNYAAFHAFPSFSRWKYPEPEVGVGEAFERHVEEVYGGRVRYSRKVANLRDGTADLVMAEFVPQDSEAKVMFFWRTGGDIAATYTQTTTYEGEEMSLWNVDDDGSYGIPDIVSIAYDRTGAVTIFVAKNSPESITCFSLVQKGGELLRHDHDQWYRYVD